MQVKERNKSRVFKKNYNIKLISIIVIVSISFEKEITFKMYFLDKNISSKKYKRSHFLYYDLI